MNVFNKLLGNKQDSLEEELDECMTLTFEQRMIGFVICLVIGVMMSFLAFLSFGDPLRFCIFYSLGNVMALSATLFFMGPVKQIRRMFDETRRIATIVYLIALFFTMFCALYFENIPSTLLACFVQFCALFWYALTYIPGGRYCFKKAVTCACDSIA